MSKKGGYVIVDLKGQSITAGTSFTLDGVTARLDRAKTKACLLSGFAIGDEEKRDVFVDLQKTEDGYIALFGQYTLTIEDDEVTITNGGVLLDDIVDANGNKRFIERNATVTYTAEGFEITYAKASLSGTHLLIVLAGNVSQGITVPTNINLAKFNVPSYVYDKIFAVWGTVFIEEKQLVYKNDEWGGQNQRVVFAKDGGNNLIIRTVGDLAINTNAHFRIAFDLLIDTAE